MKRLIIGAFLVFSLLIICYSFFNHGLRRSSFEKWNIRQFPEVGFRADLPRRGIFFGRYLEDVSVNKDFVTYYDAKEARFCFHPVIIRFSDDFFLMEIYVYRMTENSFRKFCQGKHRVNDEWEAEKTQYEPEIIEREEKRSPMGGLLNYLCFRRDVKAPNGDVFVCIGRRVNHQYDDEPIMIEEDIEAIKRILNSVQPL